MQKFTIAIEEVIADTFEVEANSIADAIQLVIANYESGDFVLEPGHLTQKKMALCTLDGTLDWFEF